MAQIVTLGELLVDMCPAEIGRRMAEVTAFFPKPGGAPANVAAAEFPGQASAHISRRRWPGKAYWQSLR